MQVLEFRQSSDAAAWDEPRWRAVTSSGGWRRNAPAPSCSHADSSRLLRRIKAAETRTDGDSGRVRRHESRERPFRSGGLFHAPSHHPQTAIMGKPPLPYVMRVSMNVRAFLQSAFLLRVIVTLSTQAAYYGSVNTQSSIRDLRNSFLLYLSVRSCSERALCCKSSWWGWKPWFFCDLVLCSCESSCTCFLSLFILTRFNKSRSTLQKDAYKK